eukprot:5621041-Prymnesium_polylepis.1
MVLANAVISVAIEHWIGFGVKVWARPRPRALRSSKSHARSTTRLIEARRKCRGRSRTARRNTVVRQTPATYGYHRSTLQYILWTHMYSGPNYTFRGLLPARTRKPYMRAVY